MSSLPRLAPVPLELKPDRGPGGDGFGANSLGHRVPPVAVPVKIAVQVARLTMEQPDGPLVPPEKVEALLKAVADRLTAARAVKDAGKGQLVYSWHRGVFVAFRSNPDDVL